MDEMRGGQEEAQRRTNCTPHKTTMQPTNQFAILLRALRVKNETLYVWRRPL